MPFLRIYFLSFCCCLITMVNAQLALPCPDIIISGEVINENSCGIGSNGSIHLDITGGVEPYSIIWTTGDTDQDSIIDLASGTYGVTVTDSNNCVAVAGFQVLLTDTMSFSDLSIYPTCDGDSGTGIISVLGGNPPYSYLWSNGSEDSTAANLPVGMHSVVVTDQSNCAVTMDVEIITNPELEVFPVVNNPLCFSDFGDVSLFILGGAPPYQIDWMGVDSTAVPPGSYEVEILDASNCSKLVAYHIVSEDPIIVELDTFLVNCHANQYEVSTSISGGNPPYVLDWFGLDTNAIFSGVHLFEVTDSMGCVYQDSLVIETVDSIDIEITSGVLECGEDSTLTSIEVMGGIAPYQISWSGTSSDSLSSHVFVGSNWVEIEDARGCVIRDSFMVISPVLFTVDFDVTAANCNQANGTLVAHVSGGSGSFIMYYANTAIDTILSALPAGSYDFKIVDENGCALDTTVKIPSTPHLYLKGFEIQDNTCFGESQASISLDFQNVQGELELEWNNGDTTTTIDSLSAGVYSLEANDSTGCVFDTIFVIDEVPSIVISSIIQYDPCANDEIGRFIKVIPSGGVEPYEIDWEYGSSSDSTFYLESIGVYNVTVTDSNGCSNSLNILVEGDQIGGEYCFEIPNAFSPNGDGSNDYWFISGLDEKPNNSLKIFNRWGIKVFETTNYQSDWEGRHDGNELPMGSYYYILDLGDGKNVFNGTISIKR